MPYEYKYGFTLVVVRVFFILELLFDLFYCFKVLADRVGLFEKQKESVD